MDVIVPFVDICACRYNCPQLLDDHCGFDDDNTLCQTTLCEFFIFQEIQWLEDQYILCKIKYQAMTTTKVKRHWLKDV